MQLTRTAGHAGRLLLLLFGLQMVDAFVTDFLVGRGYVQEGNPLVASIVGDGNFVLLKVAGVLVCLPVLLALYRRFPRLATVTVSSVIVFYGAVITWNLGVLLAV